MINFSSIMIGTMNPKELAEFYEKVFGKSADSDSEEGIWYGWQVGNTYVSIAEHSEVKGKAKEPQRAILNFETNEVQAEFERIKSLGATVIKEPYEIHGSWVATFADAEGTYFQLMAPWKG